MPEKIIESIKNCADYMPGNIVIYRIKNNLERVYHSKGIPELLGYTYSEYEKLENKAPIELICPSDRELIKQNIKRCVEQSIDSNFVFRILHKNQGYVWVHMTTKKIGVENDYSIIVANYINITNEMLANEVVLDTSDRGIMLIDKHSREILYVNRKFLEISGTTQEECMGKTCNEVICKIGDWNKEECFCMQSDYSEEVKKIPGKNGKYYRMFCKSVMLGEHEAYAYYMQDVTESELKSQKVAQLQKEIVHGYQQQINAIMKLNPDAVSTFQINITKNTCFNGVCNYPNLLLLQNKGTLDGYFEDALIFIPKNEHDYIKKTFSREIFINAFKSGRSQVYGDCHYMLSQNNERILRTTVRMVENPINHDIEGVVYTLDVTKHELYYDIMTQLFEKEYETAAIINLRNSKYTMLKYKYETENTSLGSSKDYMSGLYKLVDKFICSEEKVEFMQKADLTTIEKELMASGVYSYTVNACELNNENKLKKVSYYYLNKYHDTVLLLIEDITEITKKEQKRVALLNEALLAAENATEAKTTFLSNISHDMRTPLNGILGFAQLAKDAKTQEEKDKCIEKIMYSGNFLLQLINDTLDLSKIESNSMTLNLGEYEASEIMNGILSAIEEPAKEKNITLTVDFHKIPIKNAYVDKLRLQQIFVNLLGNAIKFTPKGGHIEFVGELLKEPINGANCKITVKDDGCGMKKDFIDHAFEAFSQQQEIQSEKIMGTGLGLAIVKRIVEMMNGFIELYSEENKGTQFDVYLPIKETGKKVAVVEQNIDIQLEGKKILLCEDHIINRELAMRLLEKKGVIVTAAVNGQEGVNKFKNSSFGYFDAILMDVRMPVMDGIEAAMEIRKLNRKDAQTIPIIALTANAFETDRKKTKEAGMNSHLSKPIVPSELYITLSEQIKNRYS